jgi:hypothetical protein
VLERENSASRITVRNYRDAEIVDADGIREDEEAVRNNTHEAWVATKETTPRGHFQLTKFLAVNNQTEALLVRLGRLAGGEKVDNAENEHSGQV